MEKRKVGRPKLGNEIKRYKGYCVRLKEDEHEELKARAAEAGVSVSRYIRERILKETNDGAEQ